MRTFFLIVLLVLSQSINAQPDTNRQLAVHFLPGVKYSGIGKLDLAKLRPTGKKIFDQSDIRYYRAATHEFMLDYAAGDRLRKESVDLRGKAFAVFVGNDAIYAGAFWSMLSSQSFEGILIETSAAQRDYPLLGFYAGYPDETYFTGTDRRADQRILEALQKAGKLYDELEFVVKYQSGTGTGKRRQSYAMTFAVVDVVKGSSDEKTIALELYFDQKELREIHSLIGIPEDSPLNFDRDKEFVLTYITQRGVPNPDRIFIGPRKK